MPKNNVIIPDTENFFRWENVDKIKKNKKYEHCDFEKIKSCLNQDPDLTELICTAARIAPLNTDNVINLKNVIDKHNNNRIKHIDFVINITPRGAVTIELLEHRGLIISRKIQEDGSEKEIIKWEKPSRDKKFMIVAKKYWETPSEDGTPRGTYWKWSALYDFYSDLVDCECVEDFATKLNLFIIESC